MSYRIKKRIRPEPSVCKCDHPQVAHYSADGHCIFPQCPCLGFKTKGRKLFTNQRAHCEYGHAHDSKEEIKTCFDLHCRLVAKEIKAYRAQVVIELLGASHHKVGTYKADFVVEHWNGDTEYVESKGRHILNLPPFPLKWALLQDQHYGDSKFKFTLVCK